MRKSVSLVWMRVGLVGRVCRMVVVGWGLMEGGVGADGRGVEAVR